MSWWTRVVNALRPDSADRDLEDEQRFHIESRADELETLGLSREHALEQASRRFGHRLTLREASRDVKILTRLESVLRDLRLGLRLLYKDAVVSSAAVISLETRDWRLHRRFLPDRRAHSAAAAGPRTESSRVSEPRRKG